MYFCGYFLLCISRFATVLIDQPKNPGHLRPVGRPKVEPGTTPAQDVTLTYDTVDALAAACGASRLDGGMHFTGAVQAGADLCAGIGTAGFQYASDLIGGEW